MNSAMTTADSAPVDTLTTAPVDPASAQLREFCMALRQWLQESAEVDDEQLPLLLQELGDQLCQLIDIQTQESQRMGARLAADVEFHARYLKAALADEWLLGADWPGRSRWRQCLIEARLFHTSQAGEQVFLRIDQLLAQWAPGRRQIAQLYLHALSAGFQGRYRGQEDLMPLLEYRRSLYQFIYRRAPDLQSPGRKVSPAAYESTLRRPFQPPPRRVNWRWLAPLLACLALLGGSQLLWLWLSWPLRARLADASPPPPWVLAVSLVRAGERPC